jgi:UPF0716 protein FxsA
MLLGMVQRTMRVWLFLVFVAVPIIEIALFIQVGGLIGLWPTLAIIVLTALVGTAVMRVQGLQALDRLRKALEGGGNPASPIAHGALILIAGVLLLTPGFFTDALGLSLLVPALRSRIIRWGAARVTVQAAGVARARRQPPASRDTIETDYEVVEDDSHPDDRGSSGWTRPKP